MDSDNIKLSSSKTDKANLKRRIYDSLYLSSQGCDSLVILNLIINNSLTKIKDGIIKAKNMFSNYEIDFEDIYKQVLDN